MKPSVFNRISTFSPLKTLNSLIHPQLPLTPKESRQLLSLLKTSFRTQLAASTNEAGSQDASDAKPGPYVFPSSDLYLRDLLKIPVPRVLNPLEPNASPQDRAARFRTAPIEVYQEFAAEGLATPKLAISALRQQTNNVLNVLEETARGDKWAVEAVLDVIGPFKALSQNSYLEIPELRRQVIRTLVQGNQIDVAGGILFKPWLLHISSDQNDADKLFELRQSIVSEVLYSVETCYGVNSGLREFLRLVERWKAHNGDVLEPSAPAVSEPHPATLKITPTAWPPLIYLRHFNPFRKYAITLLFRFAHESRPAMVSLRNEMYEICRHWVSEYPLVQARVKLYYEDNPYPLYSLIKSKGSRARPRTDLGRYRKACFDVLLALIQRSEWDMSQEVLRFMRAKLQMEQASVMDQKMIEEIEEMLATPSPAWVVLGKLKQIRWRLNGGVDAVGFMGQPSALAA